MVGPVTGVTQWMFTTGDGHLWHTQRRPDGSWEGLSDVQSVLAIPGPVEAVTGAAYLTAALAPPDGVTHWVFTTDDGHLWFTRRLRNGSWTGLHAGEPNVQPTFAIPGPVAAVAGASIGESQFIFTTADGHLWHTRFNGDWSGLGPVAIPGPVEALAGAGGVVGWSPSGGGTPDWSPDETQWVFTTADGHLWHTLRTRPDGKWSALDDLQRMLTIPAPVAAVAGAGGGRAGETHWTFSTEDGRLWHTQRGRDGTWSALNDGPPAAGLPGPVEALAGAAGADGETQWLFTVDGHLWHMLRRPNGTWSALDDVQNALDLPGPVEALAGAGWSGPSR